MKSVIICDDEEKVISILSGMIEKIFPKQFQISGYISPRQLVYEVEDGFIKSADLIFLDLEMKELDGIETARKLQRKLHMAKIIFITGYPERTEEIFDDIYPFGLLLKPFRKERLEKYIRKQFEQEGKTGRFLQISKNGRQCHISISDVNYVESRGRKLLIYKADDTMECVYERISRFCELYQEDFIRCHQSYAVNWEKAAEVSTAGITLKNGELVPISRQKYREIRAKIFTRDL